MITVCMCFLCLADEAYILCCDVQTSVIVYIHTRLIHPVFLLEKWQKTAKHVHVIIDTISCT